MIAGDTARAATLQRRIRLLLVAAIAYNVVEAGIALLAGTAVGSTALIGFGLDSVVEVSSAAALAWQFAGRDPAAREPITLKVIGGSFLGLAVLVGTGAGHALLSGDRPDSSTTGIVLAAVSLAVMPFLSAAQRRAGRELGSASAVADSHHTLLCTYLSGVLLVGLLLNSTLGWWWADPVAALVIAAVAVHEGRQAWRGDACCP